MSIWKYKYFVDVVDCKSFTQAGKKIHVTQTAISQQIASLEKKIGGTLLERKNGTVLVTKLGQIVYKHSKEMLNAHEHMITEIQHFMQNKVIYIGVDTSMNSLFLNGLRTILNLSYSENEFTVYKMDYHSAHKMLHENELDLYIGYHLDIKQKSNDIKESLLSSNKIGVYISNASSLLDKEVLFQSDLKDYPQYCTALYPCSMSEASSLLPWNEVYNVETMNLKVDFNDGYAYVDSLYFNGNDGHVRILEDYNKECVLKAYCRNGDQKSLQLLKHIQEHMNNQKGS